MHAKGLTGLSAATVVAGASATGLIFFYAPSDADQGFVQKIFYLHVPMAIVALCGFVAAAIMALGHLRSGDRSWELRSYVAIHRLESCARMSPASPAARMVRTVPPRPSPH